MTRAEEEAAIAKYIAERGVTKCPTLAPADASVEGFLARVRAGRGGRQPKFISTRQRSRQKARR